MTLFHALLLGIVEGVTEFLPVSSTFHLIFVSRLLGIPQSDFNKVFEVLIQAGAILAVAVLFARTFVSNKKLLGTLLLSFIPTSVVGVVLYPVIKTVFFEHFLLQMSMFVAVGLLFILFEHSRKNYPYRKTAPEISLKEAVIIGLAQALAVIPGVSRAGSVLIACMFLGVKRDEAAKYSFLLAVPTILAASILDAYEMRHVLAGPEGNLMLLAAGFITAFVSALVVLKWLIAYLQTHSLAGFGWYRVAVALIVTIGWVFSR